MGDGSPDEQVVLKLLGPMELRRGGEVVALPASRKTRALLAYLALSDRPLRREHLCGLLWEVPDDPRGALRWSLSKLRGLLDTPGVARLVADRETVRLDNRLLASDWRDLREAARSELETMPLADLRRVVGEAEAFVEGLDLPRCDGFQAWTTAQREDVRRWQVKALKAFAARVTDADDALWCARQRVRLDPHDDAARADLDALSRPGATPDPPAPPADPPAPQEVRFCAASDGTGLAWSRVGRGHPLVKTANWLNHLDYDWDSPVWQHWTKALTRDHCLIRYDERGNGLSDWDTADISFEAFVDDLASVVDAAELDQFDLLGISQGCSVSIAYAARNPGRVRRMVLYGGYAAGWRVRARPAELARREAMATLMREGWGQNNPAFRQMYTTLFYPDASPAEMDWFNELQRRSTSPANAVRLQDAFADIDVRALLGQVRVPTLVLHARDDAVVPFDAGRAVAAAIPGAQFVALESRNHLLLEHEPAWPRVVASIEAFLAP